MMRIQPPMYYLLLLLRITIVETRGKVHNVVSILRRCNARKTCCLGLKTVHVKFFVVGSSIRVDYQNNIIITERKNSICVLRRLLTVF